jgi:hypothetical protein
MEAMEQPPNKYAKGKIYKIVDIGYNECYYGSTYNLLCKRMDGHRKDYKKYKNGKYHYVTSFSLFDTYGVENCKIELVELYPCGSRNELEAREGYYIKNNECVNKVVAGRTKKEYEEVNKEKRRQWVEANKEHLAEYKRQYNQDNKEHRCQWVEANKEKIAEQRRQWNEANKEKIAEQRRQYREANKDKINERQRQYRLRKKEEGLI